MKIIGRCLLFFVLFATPVAANGQVSRPLPKDIQNLSNSDYFDWAVWHNSAVKREADNYNGVSKWLYGTAFSVSNRVPGLIRVYRYGYLNPQYHGPGPITIYNPYVKPKSGTDFPANVHVDISD